jgi:hypothetical protein
MNKDDESDQLECGGSTPEQLHCKRCGEGMTLVTFLREFSSRSRIMLFRCVACKFYDRVKR